MSNYETGKHYLFLLNGKRAEVATILEDSEDSVNVKKASGAKADVLRDPDAAKGAADVPYQNLKETFQKKDILASYEMILEDAKKWVDASYQDAIDNFGDPEATE
jgi:hypothetical protein